MNAPPPSPRTPSPRSTIFLPLTITATTRIATALPAGQPRNRVHAVGEQARAADLVAGECWTALLAGCDTDSLYVLRPRLSGLAEATSRFVGARWWAGEGAAYRRRVARAQTHIAEAIAEGDGSEYARAFVGYDDAVASTVVCAHRYTRSAMVGDR